jgi:hypothetical protein
MFGGISGSAVVAEENRILNTLHSSRGFYEGDSLCHVPLFALYISISARSISSMVVSNFSNERTLFERPENQH